MASGTDIEDLKGTNVEVLKKTLIEEIYEKSRNGNIGIGIKGLEEITGFERNTICYGLSELEKLDVISRYKKRERIFRWFPLGWVTKNTYTYRIKLTR